MISLLLDPEVEELSNDGSIKLKALAGGKVASEQREQAMMDVRNKAPLVEDE